MVGATDSFQLSGSPTEVVMSVQEPGGPASAMAEDLADWEPRRIFLNIEKILGVNGAPPFYVYVNVPRGDNPEAHPDLYVGELPMFGLREASYVDERHSGEGLAQQLEITGLYNRLSLRDDWDPKTLRFLFVPKYPGDMPPVSVERMTLYFS
jgi:tyrosinase